MSDLIERLRGEMELREACIDSDTLEDNLSEAIAAINARDARIEELTLLLMAVLDDLDLGAHPHLYAEPIRRALTSKAT